MTATIHNPVTQALTAKASPRTALVDIQTVRAIRGVSTAAVFAAVECGQFLWVFDVALARDGRRELRFWAIEVFSRRDLSALLLEEVIPQILPESRTSFSCAECEHLFLISKQSALRLVRQLGCISTHRAIRVTRTALAAFLRQRWIGGNTK